MPITLNPNLKFDEAIKYFQGKVNLPTATWTDLWEGQHAKAFVVAGAMKDDLLTDFRGAIDDAISQGTGYKAFREQFDSIVQKHGWAYNGGAGWRSRVIYKTNMRTAYMAGRFQQMEAVAQTRPYWQYRHSKLVSDPRPEHVAWDGLVLKHDDPWWSTHYPPNGWGCKCRVHALSDRDLKRIGKDKPDTAPTINYQDQLVGKRGPNPKVVSVPEGIDAGWAYSVGEAAQGKTLAQKDFDWWDKQDRQGWEVLTKGSFSDFGRQQKIPFDEPTIKLAGRESTVKGVTQSLVAILGANEKVFNVKGVPVTINAHILGRHIQTNRSEYLPLINEVLNDPFEIWQSFERHKGTGKVILRYRIIKAVKVKNKEGVLLVIDASKGKLNGWTFVPPGNVKYLQNQRYGKLIYGRN